MLDLYGSSYRDCDRVSRRSLLQVGALAVGGMTLAMMTRAALGHTGRALTVARSIAAAYLMVAAAALTRAIGAEASRGWHEVAVLASGVLWLAAFALFLTIYWPVLTQPRPASAA